MADNPVQRIHRLPDTVINQIAAGEVIERPVSVVKELLENSLDAGARNLTIEVQRGGVRLIRVVDDGQGIHPDDLQLAVDRHTTSKLARAEDLVRIGTLGFRGEALSSIAAVARLTLTSRQADAANGWTIKLADTGATPIIRPAAYPVGTSVEVRDLFYNTPARRKFMRSEQTEFIHIQDLVKRIALCRAGLGVRLVHNSRQVLHVPGNLQEPEDRMQVILGGHFAGHSVKVQQRSGVYILNGWMGLPEAARSQSNLQYFYLNGRSIRDKLINHAVRLACQDRLYPGHQPAYLLYLEMDNDLADINVHPAKHEVRFVHPRDVHDFVYGALVEALAEGTATAGQYAVTPAKVRETMQPDTNSAWRTSEAAPVYQASGHRHANLAQPARDGVKALALIHGRYIIAEDCEGLVLVDSLRARELVALVRMTAAFADGAIRSRPVLVPLVLPLSAEGMELLERHQYLLTRLGLVIRNTAPSAVMVCELPLALPQADALALVRDVISILKDEASEESLGSTLLTLFARHASDCAPADLTLTEMQTLLTELLTLRAQINSQSFNSAYRVFNQKDLQYLLDTRR